MIEDTNDAAAALAAALEKLDGINGLILSPGPVHHQQFELRRAISDIIHPEYYDPSEPERHCEYDGCCRAYHGKAVYCSLVCVVLDA